MTEPIQLVKDTIGRDDISALIDWLKQEPIPQLSKGKLTVEFEEKFAKDIGVKHALLVNSGSSALLLAMYHLKKLGKKKVVVPALCWATDIAPVIQFGLEPIIVDCNLFDLSVDYSQLEEIFIKENPDAFVCVSVLGIPPRMELIKRLCDQYKVMLIEDFCESHGSEINGRKIGSFGDMSMTSMYIGHICSAIEAGVICTNNSEIYESLVMYRSHGWVRDLSRERQFIHRHIAQVSEFEMQYTFFTEGFNVRSTDLNAFIGLRQLDKLPFFVEQRFKNFNRYIEGVDNTLLAINNYRNMVIANLGFPLVVESDRDKVVKRLEDAKVECRPLISGNIARHPAYKKYYNEKYPLKNADIIHKQGLYLPNHPYLTEHEIDFVIGLING